jgi:hypothetical protein
MLEVLQHLGVSKTCMTPLHTQSDGMVKCYIKTVREHLRKVIASHQRNWDSKLPIFLLAYRTSTHDTMGYTSASPVFGIELNCPATCCLGNPLTRHAPQSITWQILVNPIHINNYAHKHLKLASYQIKTCYSKLVSCAGYHECNDVWLSLPTHMKGKSPKLQSP